MAIKKHNEDVEICACLGLLSDGQAARLREAGAEIHLRTLQPLALHVVNSIFLGDYLTSEGQAGNTDLDMIADPGFEVEGTGTNTLPEHRRGERASTADDAHEPEPGSSGDDSTGRLPGSARADLVAVRRRGAGTDLPPNA